MGSDPPDEIAPEDFGRYRDDAVKKGGDFLKAMQADENDAETMFNIPQSKFKGTQDLENHGWFRIPLEIGFSSQTAALLEKFQQYGLSLRGKRIEWQHKFDSNIKGQNYSATSAFFKNGYNAEEKVIYALDLSSPTTLEREGINGFKGGVVPLKYWSDVTYLEWLSQAGEMRRDLKYICHHTVTNPKTKRIVKDAFQTTPGEKDKLFKMTEDEGKAILASPNGCTVAYILITHKSDDQLGRKEVVWVHAFFMLDDTLHLVFALENVSRKS